MEFSSLDEAINYIKQAIASSMLPIGDEMEEIMKKAIQTDIYDSHSPEVYNRTGQLGETPTITHADANGVTVEYADNGDWSSAITGEHFFPLYGFKAGKVWSPNGGYYSADPTTTAFIECQERIPEELVALLRNMGIPVE